LAPLFPRRARERFLSDIFTEVDEEVRKDVYKQLWQRYGWYAVGVVVVLVLIAAGYTGWQEWQQRQAEERAQIFSESLSLAASGKDSEALDQFAALAAEGGGYGVLASLEEAKLRRRKGDVDGAVAIYDGISSNADVDRSYRDLATVLSVMLQVDKGDPATLTARLDPLTGSGEPYRFVARELKAVIALHDGRREDARQIYADLADDAAAPQSLRARAAEMATALEA
jgi:hypothetical protein